MIPPRLSRDTALLMVSNVGGAGLSFLLSVLIGRVLGEEGLGAYAVVMAWVFPLSLLVEFGLATLATRDVAQDTRLGEDYLRMMAAARLLFGGAAMLALWLGAPLLSSDPLVVAGLRISAPMVVILPFFSAFTAVFKARGGMWTIPWLNIGMLLVQVVWTAAAFLNGGDVIDALLINMLTSAGQLAAAWLVYRWRFYQPLGTQRAAPLRAMMPLLRKALPFALAALFAALQTRLSVLLLEQFASTAQVGYYAAANRFVEAARMFPNAFFGALFPTLSSLAAQPDRMRRTFARAMRGLGGFGLAAWIGSLLLGLPVITLTYGTAFNPTASVLYVLMGSLLFSLLRGGRTLYWYALGRERYVNAVNGLVIALQGALSLWLIPSYGAVGAAVALVAVEIIGLVLLWREINLNRRAHEEIKVSEHSLV